MIPSLIKGIALFLTASVPVDYSSRVDGSSTTDDFLLDSSSRNSHKAEGENGEDLHGYLVVEGLVRENSNWINVNVKAASK